MLHNAPALASGRLNEAVELWLDDNDQDSLPLMASLAREGHAKARRLLGRIEVTDRASTTFVKSLTGTARAELFRAPGSGLFRASWLQRLADAGDATAGMLVAAMRLGINHEAVETLLAAGESEAAEHLIRKIAVDGSNEDHQKILRIIGDNHELSPYVLGFQLSREGVTTGKTALERMKRDLRETWPKGPPSPDENAATVFVDIGYQAGGEVPGFHPDNAWYGAVADWVNEAPAAQPLAEICRTGCDTNDFEGCAVTAFGLAGGYYEVIRFDSPLESIIPQDRYLGSIRASSSALRKIAFAMSDSVQAIFSPAKLRERSACLARAIFAARRK